MSESIHIERNELLKLAAFEEGELPAILQAAAEHLKSCEVCQLRSMLLGRPGQPDPWQTAADGTALDLGRKGCPDEAIWVQIASGELQMQEAEDAVRHAAECDHCGTLLRVITENTAEETAAEAAIIDSLGIATPEGRKALAKKLAATPYAAGRAESNSWWNWGAWPKLAAAAAFVAIVGLGGWWFMRPADPFVLLAQGYGQRRNLEGRFDGAAYGPLSQVRGKDTSPRPSALKKADVLIDQELEKHPSDPRWLRARALRELLDGENESAVHELNALLDSNPQDARLLTDLGLAYLAMGNSGDSKEPARDYGQAYELFSRVLAQEPNNLVARFNRAIAAERELLYPQAKEDWDLYLKADPTGDWADEARKNLSRVTEKINRHDALVPRINEDPAAFSAAVNNPNQREILARQSEAYADVALTKWMPALADSDAARANAARRAVKDLAALLEKEHGDPWLADLIAQPELPSARPAIDELAKSLAATRYGNFGAAHDHALASSHAFTAAGNRAGSFVAHYQEMYALQRSAQSAQCVLLARALLQELPATYVELRIQTRLDLASCTFRLAPKDPVSQEITAAEEQADKAGYETLAARARGFLVGILLAQGKQPWQQAQAALEKHWDGRGSRFTAYQLYFELAGLAENEDEPFLAMAAWTNAVQVAANEGRPSVEAMTRPRLAKAQSAVNDLESAKLQYVLANLALAQFDGPDARRFRGDTQLDLAESEVRSRDYRTADRVLAQAEAGVADVQLHNSKLRYATLLGEVRLRTKQAEAREALLPALLIAEGALPNLHSEKDRADWSRAAGKAYRLLTEVELESRSNLPALDTWEWYRGAPLRTSGRVPQDFRPDAVTPALAGWKNATLVSYAVLPGGLARWVGDDRGVQTAWTPGSTAELTRLAPKFASLCGDPHSDQAELRASSRRLYDLLMAPIAGWLDPQRTLIVEADDVLADVPWEALQDAGRHYFGERFAVATTPGLHYLDGLRQPRSVRADQVALVVDSSGGRGSFPVLPDVELETRGVKERFPHATRLAAAQANARTMESLMPRADLMHYAGHAAARSGSWGLMLAGAPDGDLVPWTAEQVARVKLPHCDLVVLAACNTEKGDDSSGSNSAPNDPDSLPVAFLRAGVPQVVASRWNVDSCVTAALMAKFYDALLSGKSAAQSMRLAASDIRSRAATAHPYYWTAFRVFGRT